MTGSNEKHDVVGEITDNDGVSLYPSAQKRCYYPTGIGHCLS